MKMWLFSLIICIMWSKIYFNNTFVLYSTHLTRPSSSGSGRLYSHSHSLSLCLQVLAQVEVSGEVIHFIINLIIKNTKSSRGEGRRGKTGERGKYEVPQKFSFTWTGITLQTSNLAYDGKTTISCPPTRTPISGGPRMVGEAGWLVGFKFPIRVFPRPGKYMPSVSLCSVASRTRSSSWCVQEGEALGGIVGVWCLR